MEPAPFYLACNPFSSLGIRVLSAIIKSLYAVTPVFQHAVLQRCISCLLDCCFNTGQRGIVQTCFLYPGTNLPLYKTRGEALSVLAAFA